jgi:hypothetical protein
MRRCERVTSKPYRHGKRDATMRKVCECGVVYEITDRHVPWRDKDSIECFTCGKELVRWNGSTTYAAVFVVDEDGPYVDDCQVCGTEAELQMVEDGDRLLMVCADCAELF